MTDLNFASPEEKIKLNEEIDLNNQIVLYSVIYVTINIPCGILIKNINKNNSKNWIYWSFNELKLYYLKRKLI